MKHSKPLIRRTFLQERFEILMQLQQSGHATFEELTELDELINRDPKLTHIILEEMESPIDTNSDYDGHKPTIIKHDTRKTLKERIRSFFTGWFQITAIQTIPGY